MGGRSRGVLVFAMFGDCYNYCVFLCILKICHFSAAIENLVISSAILVGRFFNAVLVIESSPGTLFLESPLMIFECYLGLSKRYFELLIL